MRGGLVLSFAICVGIPDILREFLPFATTYPISNLLDPTIWEGMSLRDLLMPGFLFISGAAMAQSVSRRLNENQTLRKVGWRLARRALSLFAVGLLLDGGVLDGSSQIRWVGPVQRIAICGTLAAIASLMFDSSMLLGLAVILLVNYGLAFEAFVAPIPLEQSDFYAPRGISPYSPEFNLAAYVDRLLLSGRKLFGTWDSEGLLTTLPALAMALVGATFGKKRSWKLKNNAKSERFPLFPLVVSIVTINAGILLSEWQPIIPSLLTPAFVAIALGLFFPLPFLFPVVARLPLLQNLLGLIEWLGKHSLIAMILLHEVERYGASIASGFFAVIGLPLTRPQTFIWLFVAAISVFTGSLAIKRKCSTPVSHS